MTSELLPDVQRLHASQKRQPAEELLFAADGSEEVGVDPAIVELLESRLAT